MLVIVMKHVSFHCVLVRELKKGGKLLCRDSELNISSTFVSKGLGVQHCFCCAHKSVL